VPRPGSRARVSAYAGRFVVTPVSPGGRARVRPWPERLLELHLLLLLALLLPTTPVQAAAPVLVDRPVARFIAPETGGVGSPRFVFERELAFEARIEALADRRYRGTSFRDYHVRAALERHIAETLLSSLRIEPTPSARDLARQTEAARLILLQRVGGPQALAHAVRVEGLGRQDVMRILRRRARASLYLHRMVAPMLTPSDAELRNIHKTLQTPFHGRAFPRIALPLRRWYISQRLAESLVAFYQNARGRISVTFLK